MTETQAEYVAKRQGIFDNPDELKQLRQRVAELEDELVNIRYIYGNVRAERDEARQRIATLEAALDRSKHYEIIGLRWLQERDAWAKAWKAKAKFDRRGWLDMIHCLDWLPWHKRRAAMAPPPAPKPRLIDLLIRPRISE